MSEQMVGCPGCGKHLRVLSPAPGQEFLCPVCGKGFRLGGRGSLSAEADDEDFDSWEDEPGRGKGRSSSSAWVYVLVGGLTIGLGMAALGIALTFIDLAPQPQVQQAERPQVRQTQQPPVQPSLPPQTRQPQQGQAFPPAQPPPPRGPEARPGAESGNRPPPPPPPMPDKPGSTRHEAIVQRIWQLTDTMWEAYKEARGTLAGSGVRSLPPPQAQQFAQRMEAINKELLALINEAKQLPQPDFATKVRVDALNHHLYVKLLLRHRIRELGPPGVYVPIPSDRGASAGPAANSAEEALREFRNALDQGPAWTPKVH